MGRMPRSHHFIPKFYLRGFTLGGSDDSPLTVTKIETGEQRSGSPQSVAIERDFHLVNIPGVDPMHVEKGLAQLEGKWATLVRSVLERQDLPSDDSLGDLFSFVSFMSVRIPIVREKITEFVDRTSKLELFALFSTVEGRQQFKNIIMEQLPTMPYEQRTTAQRLMQEDPDMLQMTDFALSGQFDVEFDQTSNVQMMLQMALALIPVMEARNWSLWTLNECARDLICSDRPVCLTWTTPRPGPYAPGFGCKNTLLTIPLTRRLAVASQFECAHVPRILTDAEAADLNQRTTMFASETYAAAS